jgi:uncharacterized glyoxalase superfamily protein PhnB
MHTRAVDLVQTALSFILTAAGAWVYATAPEQSLLSVNVGDVDAAYAEAQRRGYEIVHPLTHEPWGVRRFFVRDPHGIVVNIVGHAD